MPPPSAPPRSPLPAAPDAARPLLERPEVAPTAAVVAQPAARPPRGRPLELVWFDEDRAEDVASSEAFAAIAREAKPPKAPPRRAGRRSPPPASPKPELSPRKLFVRALHRGTPTDPQSLTRLLDEALHDEDAEAMPMALVEGSLTLSFDPRRELETVSALARAVAQGHKAVADELAHADELGGAAVNDSQALRRMTERVHAAWRQTNRGLPADYLESTATRSLVLERAYQRLELLDASWLRAELVPEGRGGNRPSVVYLPDAMAKRLPLCTELTVRMVVEVMPRQDMLETSPLALCVVAIARDPS